MPATNAPLVAVELIAGSIWLGGLVCLVVVARASKVLDAASRVSFFRAVGRLYGIVASTSLLIAIGVGLALSWPPSTWSNVVDTAVALAGVLVLLSVMGMGQARWMTVARRNAIALPDDIDAARSVRRGQIMAGALRGAIALVSLAVVVLAAQAVSH